MQLKTSYISIIGGLLFFSMGISLSAQLQFPGRALGLGSRLKAAEVIYLLPPADSLEIEAALEMNRSGIKKALQFALERPASISPENNGSWSREQDMKVWRVHLISPGAYSMGLHFNRYQLLPGVKLFIYDPAQEMIKGAFTSGNNSATSVFPVGHIAGDELIIELQLPVEMDHYGELELESISHAFLSTSQLSGAADCPAGEFGCSQVCELDVNCVEGDDWWRVKPSVVRIYTKTLYCSGVLVNNTAYDGTPYIITAEHCVNTQTTASGSVFQFNYQSADCFGDDGPLDMSLAGAQLMAVGDSIDFSLLKLNQSPPASYGVQYAGWDRSDFQTSATTTLHHPWGDVKKISFDYELPSIPQQQSDVPYADLYDYHYHSYWWVRRWDVGSTEGGSSGAPIFNAGQRLIGTLSGGRARCGDSIGYDEESGRVIYNLALNYDDYFTRFGVAWDYEEAKGNDLKTWLDPINSDAGTIWSYNPTSTEPLKISSGLRYHLFPNPASDLIHITSREEGGGEGDYRLYNLSGALLRSGKLDYEGRATLQTGWLPVGIYLVSIGKGKQVEHHKMVISR